MKCYNYQWCLLKEVFSKVTKGEHIYVLSLILIKIYEIYVKSQSLETFFFRKIHELRDFLDNNTMTVVYTDIYRRTSRSNGRLLPAVE